MSKHLIFTPKLSLLPIKMFLTEAERIEILIIVGCGDRKRTQIEVCEYFNDKYPNREHINQATVSKIVKKYNEVGHVRDKPRSGRPKISDDVKLDILVSLEERPHSSTRSISQNFENIHDSTVAKFLKKEKWHAYKCQGVQELLEDDPERRNEFCEILMDNYLINDALFPRNIIFSDEATFFLDGMVNRQNCRYWSSENPHWFREIHTQRPRKINVWAGIIRNTVIGPYFLRKI